MRHDKMVQFYVLCEFKNVNQFLKREREITLNEQDQNIMLNSQFDQ